VEQYFIPVDKRQNMKRIRENSLSLIFLLLFVLSLGGQAYTGWKEYNQEMVQENGRTVNFGGYLSTPHFFSAMFENWESEFLQMALLVVLTIFLYQKGSSESNDPDGGNEVDREPDARKKHAPWPVKAGGLVLALYKNSLSIVLFLLFFFSMIGHFVSSLKDYNQEQMLRHLPTETPGQYFTGSRFWFESFQNWQSEFLSVFAIVVLSIFLRQKGSSQSKPVDAPNQQTSE
jgi:hypothetical protein